MNWNFPARLAKRVLRFLRSGSAARAVAVAESVDVEDLVAQVQRDLASLGEALEQAQSVVEEFEGMMLALEHELENPCLSPETRAHLGAMFGQGLRTPELPECIASPDAGQARPPQPLDFARVSRVHRRTASTSPVRSVRRIDR